MDRHLSRFGLKLILAIMYWCPFYSRTKIELKLKLMIRINDISVNVSNCTCEFLSTTYHWISINYCHIPTRMRIDEHCKVRRIQTSTKDGHLPPSENHRYRFTHKQTTEDLPILGTKRPKSFCQTIKFGRIWFDFVAYLHHQFFEPFRHFAFCRHKLWDVVRFSKCLCTQTRMHTTNVCIRMRHTRNINYLRHMPFIINYILLWHSIVFTSISPCSTLCVSFSSDLAKLRVPKPICFSCWWRKIRANMSPFTFDMLSFDALSSSSCKNSFTQSFFSNLILDICLHITSIFEWRVS